MLTEQQKNGFFAPQYFERTQIMLVDLQPEFRIQNWHKLESFYTDKIGEGILNWDLDLRKIDFLNSFFLGLLISFNTALITRGGALRLMVAKGSKVAETLYATRLNRIITVREL